MHADPKGDNIDPIRASNSLASGPIRRAGVRWLVLWAFCIFLLILGAAWIAAMGEPSTEARAIGLEEDALEIIEPWVRSSFHSSWWWW